MMRKDFYQWLRSPQGRVLVSNETLFLKQTITLDYTQNILQLGCLGLENKFIDSDVYASFMAVDTPQWGCQEYTNIHSNAVNLPIRTHSIDLAILPHLLEFEANQQQVLNELKRTLKPEGVLIILGFNPWSIFSIIHSLQDKTRFISRKKLLYWLRMLNFEAEVVAGFHSGNKIINYRQCLQNKNSLGVTSYAIHAIKRQFSNIPWQSNWVKSSQFSLAGSNVSALTTNKNE